VLHCCVPLICFEAQLLQYRSCLLQGTTSKVVYSVVLWCGVPCIWVQPRQIFVCKSLLSAPLGG
jgi:hypothetical protein